MKNVRPVHHGTIIDPRTREWIPESFDGFLAELKHVTESCRAPVLFRGHSKREWLLDSTFARSCKSALFGIPVEERLTEELAASIVLHRILLNLYFLKFGYLVKPHPDLRSAEKAHGIDAWFELMKRYQQYPEEDRAHLKGSNLLDWTHSADIALYYANCERRGDGAVFVCDAAATGKTLQIIPVEQILKLMDSVGNSGKPLGCPLLFHPERQIENTRAENQQAVYWAQMDLRYDLEWIWHFQEYEQHGETIIAKLILPAGSQGSVKEYLEQRGITNDFVYPDKSSV